MSILSSALVTRARPFGSSLAFASGARLVAFLMTPAIALGCVGSAGTVRSQDEERVEREVLRPEEAVGRIIVADELRLYARTGEVAHFTRERTSGVRLLSQGTDFLVDQGIYTPVVFMIAQADILRIEIKRVLRGSLSGQAVDGDDWVMSPGGVAGRIALNSLANIGGGLTGALGGGLLGAPGGVFGALIGATGGLGLGILFIAPAYMQSVCHAQGCDGSYAAGVGGGLATSLLFIAIESTIDDDSGTGSRVIAYALLGPILQAAVYELSVQPLGRRRADTHAERGWSLSPFVSLSPENRLLGLSLNTEFR